MKILLTGHRGFIGSHLLQALQHHDVVTYEWADGARPSIKGFDWVMHIGAISSTTERDVEKVLRQNLDFSIDLYNDCQANFVNMQYSSSASIYGMGTDFRETAAVDPKTPYAWSKYLFERYVQQHPGTSLAQGFRYFNVYGPEGEEHKGSQASPFCQFGRQAREHGEVRVFENSDQYRRDFVPVDQVCQTHLAFLQVQESGVWNVGTGTARSFLDVARQFTDRVIEVPMPDVLKPSYQVYTCADMTHTRETLKRWQL